MAGKVLVAGGGASGLMAAAAAARAGAEVTVLEAMDRPGRKLLLTGNGRCNLTNMDPELPLRYHGSGAGLARSVTGRFGAENTRRFFEELGLLTTEKNGYVYPYNMQSSSVLGALTAELRRWKVKLKLNERIRSVRREEMPGGREGWAVQTDTWSYAADALILACGSRCMPETGSDGSGYRIAEALGHTVIPAGPALAPLICRGDFLAGAAGARCRAAVSLYEDGRRIGQETGELQWTKQGVSGIVVFQLSRFVREDRPAGTYRLSIDLLPEYDAAYLAELLARRAGQLGRESASVLLSGTVHSRLIPVILDRAAAAAERRGDEDRRGSGKMRLPEGRQTGRDVCVSESGNGHIPGNRPTGRDVCAPESGNGRAHEAQRNGRDARASECGSGHVPGARAGGGRGRSMLCRDLTPEMIRAVTAQMKDFRLPVVRTGSFDVCQVCRGGVDGGEVFPETLESRLQRGLFLAGELLDVDGPCGGYNLQWAWASGSVAGNAAARFACGTEEK